MTSFVWNGPTLPAAAAAAGEGDVVTASIQPPTLDDSYTIDIGNHQFGKQGLSLGTDGSATVFCKKVYNTSGALTFQAESTTPGVPSTVTVDSTGSVTCNKVNCDEVDNPSGMLKLQPQAQVHLVDVLFYAPDSKFVVTGLHNLAVGDQVHLTQPNNPIVGGALFYPVVTEGYYYVIQQHTGVGNDWFKLSSTLNGSAITTAADSRVNITTGGVHVPGGLTCNTLTIGSDVVMPKVYCRIKAASNQVTSNGVDIPTYDNTNAVTRGLTTAQVTASIPFTAPRDGDYFIHAHVTSKAAVGFSAAEEALSVMRITRYRNNDSGTNLAQSNHEPGSHRNHSVSTIETLLAGDTLAIKMFNDSGYNMTIGAHNSSALLLVHNVD